MRPVRHVFPVWGAILLAAASGAAVAQDYPNRVVRLVTSEPGGSDLAARILTPLLSTKIGRAHV